MKNRGLPAGRQGFTLVELLVVVGIMAILSVIGISIYGGARVQARDARRRLDIDAIANALEANRKPGASAYEAMASVWFASGSVPLDSNNPTSNGFQHQYGVKYPSPATYPTIADWPTTLQVPSDWSIIDNGTPPAAASWTVCARLEIGPKVYCKKSAF